MAASEQELIKIIDTKQTFADLAYKEYRSTKFGMTFCCPVNFNDHSIVNELCDWEAGKQTIYGGETYTMSTWDWASFIINGTGAPDSWVKRVEPIHQEWTKKYTPYGTVMNSRLMDLIKPSVGYDPLDNNMTIVFKESTIDHWISMAAGAGYTITRGTSKIIPVTPLYCTGIDYIGADLTQNTCWLQTTKRAKKELVAEVGLGVPVENYNFGMFDWLSLKGSGNTIDASGDFTMTLKVNTATEGIKNGGKEGDKVWFLIDCDGNGTSGILHFYSPTNTQFTYASQKNATYAAGATATVDTPINNGIIIIVAKEMDIHARAKTSFSGTTYNGMGAEYFNISPVLTSANRVYNGYDCFDDPETIVIQVEDSLGNVVKDYPVIIDNTFVGKTDAGGMFYHIIKDASKDTKHMINCKCFTTTGKCNQQLIKIVTTTDPLKPTCTQKAIDCL